MVVSVMVSQLLGGKCLLLLTVVLDAACITTALSCLSSLLSCANPLHVAPAVVFLQRVCLGCGSSSCCSALQVVWASVHTFVFDLLCGQFLKLTSHMLAVLEGACVPHIQHDHQANCNGDAAVMFPACTSRLGAEHAYIRCCWLCCMWYSLRVLLGLTASGGHWCAP
jgi:hypothetical protein